MIQSHFLNTAGPEGGKEARQWCWKAVGVLMALGEGCRLMQVPPPFLTTQILTILHPSEGISHVKIMLVLLGTVMIQGAR